MPDYAHKKTDDMIAKLEKKIKSDYRKANKECKAKAKEHFAKFAKKDNEMSAKVKAGEITQQEYKAWRVGQMATGKRWNDMCDQLAKDYTNADKIARSTVQGHMAEAYALNRNYGMYQVEKAAKINTSFTLYDRRTVERLWRDNPKLMPSPPKLKTSKAISWNNRHIRSALTQGILQGESIPKIADRMDRVAGAGYSAAVRAARTSMTGAQNAGRLDSYEEAADMGIKMTKMWLATLDDRTRASHIEMDGETVPIDEPFSNGLMFPADPDGDDPAEIYNCRCTMVSQIEGFERDPSDMGWRNDSKLDGMSYEDWKGEKASALSIPEPKPKAVPVECDQLKALVKPEDYKATMEMAGKSPAGMAYSRFLNDITSIERGSGVYYGGSHRIKFTYNTKYEGKHKYSTLFHEMNHHLDQMIMSQAERGAVDHIHFKEVDVINEIHSSAKLFPRRPSNCDEFLGALRKDIKELEPIVNDKDKGAIARLLCSDEAQRNATAGIQDALDGFFGTQDKYQLPWGHGDRYYNKWYNRAIKDRGLHNKLKEQMQKLGFDASNQAKVKNLTKQYRAASEAFANVGSAATVGGEELAAWEKYMPNTLEAYKKIMGGIKL